jgi:hypothetical protein
MGGHLAEASEVVGGRDKAFPKDVMPEAVHDDAGGERVLRADNPACESQPVIRPSFRHRRQLQKYSYLLNGAWAALSAGIRLGGDCFRLTPVGENILNRNLLVTARR